MPHIPNPILSAPYGVFGIVDTVEEVLLNVLDAFLLVSLDDFWLVEFEDAASNLVVAEMFEVKSTDEDSCGIVLVAEELSVPDDIKSLLLPLQDINENDRTLAIATLNILFIIFALLSINYKRTIQLDI